MPNDRSSDDHHTHPPALQQPAMTNITVLGLGAMGSRMAANYAAAGHDVTVWNRTPGTAERLADTIGVAVADAPRAAASDADFVVSMVTDDAAAEAIWLDPSSGVLASMKPDAIAIESSTVTPAAVRHLDRAARRAGISFVEAPVVGSRPQVEARGLLYILGGDSDAIDAASAVIDVNAGRSVRVGAIGNAATLKLAINGLFAAQVAAYAEVAGFLDRSDLDATHAIEVLKELPITSPGLARILGLIVDRSYAPSFPIHLVAKDLKYLGRSAAEVGATMPVTDAARTVFASGAGGDEGSLDIAGIAQRYQQASDTPR